MSLKKSFKRRLSIRLLRIAGFFMAGYLLIGFLILPLLVKFIAPSLVSREIAGDVRIGWIWMNPLVFSLSLRDVSAVDPDGEVVVSFDRLYANADPVRSLFTGELTADSFNLRGLDLRVHIDEAGEVNLARAFAPTRPAEPSPATEPFDIPAAVLSHFKLEDARIAFSDHSRALHFEQAITSLNLELNDIRTRPDHENVYEFTALTGADESIHLSGTFRLNPLSVAGSIAIEGLHLPAYGPFYEGILDIEMASGRAFAGADFFFRPLAPEPELGLVNGRFALEGIDLRERGEEAPFLLLESLTVEGIRLDLFAHEAGVAEIALSDGRFRVRRLQDGSIDLLGLLPERVAAAGDASAGPPPAADPLQFGVRSDGEDLAAPINAVLSHLETLGESDWRASIERFRLADFDVELTDLVTADPTLVSLRGIGLDIDGLSNAAGEKAAINFRMGINAEGRVGVSGEASVEPPSADLRFEVSELALGDFGAIVETFVPVRLDSAFLNLDATLSIVFSDEHDPVIEVQADSRVRDFSLRMSDASEPWLAFSEFRVDAAHLHSEPMNVGVEEILLSAPRIRVERDADGQLVLLNLLPEEVDGALDERAEELAEIPQAELEEAVGGAADEAPTELPLDFLLGRFRVEDGRFEWIDAAVQPMGRLVVSALNLEVTDVHLESDASRPTGIDLSATFADAGQIRVRGGLIPTDPSLQSKAVVEIREIPLQVFTPYAADAVGRPITEGAFGADFDVRVDNNSLASTNQLRVQSIQFGSPIPGSSGAGLPVGVAVAALQDRNGLILLDVPIRGDLDNPDFRPGQLFLGILRNATLRALTAPLSLAGSLVDGSISGLSLMQGEETGEASLDLSSIRFSPGSDELGPRADETLAALAAFLNERPEAMLRVIPSVAPDEDLRAQALARLEERLATISAPSRSQALRQLYAETFEGRVGQSEATSELVPAPEPEPAPEPASGPEPASEPEPEPVQSTAPSQGAAETDRGFFLSGEPTRTIKRSGFYARNAKSRRSTERGFYSGQTTSERPSSSAPSTEDSADAPISGDVSSDEAPDRAITLGEMERRLMSAFSGDDEALSVLAAERARQVRSRFVEELKVAPSRLLGPSSERPIVREGARVIFEFATDLE